MAFSPAGLAELSLGDSVSVEQLRISGDGQRLVLVRKPLAGGTTSDLEIYRRGASAWNLEHSESFFTGSNGFAQPVISGDGATVVVFRHPQSFYSSSTGTEVKTWTRDGTTWTNTSNPTLPAGFTVLAGALNSDGSRLAMLRTIGSITTSRLVMLASDGAGSFPTVVTETNVFPGETMGTWSAQMTLSGDGLKVAFPYYTDGFGAGVHVYTLSNAGGPWDWVDHQLIEDTYDPEYGFLNIPTLNGDGSRMLVSYFDDPYGGSPAPRAARALLYELNAGVWELGATLEETASEASMTACADVYVVSATYALDFGITHNFLGPPDAKAKSWNTSASEAGYWRNPPIPYGGNAAGFAYSNSTKTFEFLDEGTPTTNDGAEVLGVAPSTNAGKRMFEIVADEITTQTILGFVVAKQSLYTSMYGVDAVARWVGIYDGTGSEAVSYTDFWSSSSETNLDNSGLWPLVTTGDVLSFCFDLGAGKLDKIKINGVSQAFDPADATAWAAINAWVAGAEVRPWLNARPNGGAPFGKFTLNVTAADIAHPEAGYSAWLDGGGGPGPGPTGDFWTDFILSHEVP
ncbi:hypothetical protein [Caldimonas sp. KR1-144]|uniref:hypothetical protein n=1 Tax=Caldimonas sp. KR1-144 TaxID=3400911 RepID=UPI003C037D52